MQLSALAAEQPEARERLLDAAEKLFAENGYGSVALRSITAQAGVHPAAANYYFKTKQGLFRAVFERRVKPMNEERDHQLRKAWPEAATAPDVSVVLGAFIGPTIQVSASPGAENFRKLSGRTSTDPDVRGAVYDLYDVAANYFVRAISKSCPELSTQDLVWRLSCVFGAMMYVRADGGRIHQLLGLDHTPTDADEAIRHLVPYLAAILKLDPIEQSDEVGK